MCNDFDRIFGSLYSIKAVKFPNNCNSAYSVFALVLVFDFLDNYLKVKVTQQLPINLVLTTVPRLSSIS